MPLLICEGVCNPRRQALEDAIDRYRRSEARSREAGDPVYPITDPVIVAELRRLQYRDHVRALEGPFYLYSCTTCGAVRKWG